MLVFSLNRNLLLSAVLVCGAALASPAVSAADGDPAEQLRERTVEQQRHRTQTDSDSDGVMQERKEKMERERLRDESHSEGAEQKREKMEKRDQKREDMNKREDMKMKKGNSDVEDHLRRGKGGNR